MLAEVNQIKGEYSCLSLSEFITHCPSSWELMFPICSPIAFCAMLEWFVAN